MIYHTHATDPQGHLRRLVGQLSVDLARQRAKATASTGQTAVAQPATPAVLPARLNQAELSGVLAPYVAAHAATGCSGLEREAVRTRSPSARNLLAIVATRGRHGYVELASLLESTPGWGDSPAALALADGGDPIALLSLARVVSAQRLVASDEAIAWSLYDFVAATFGVEAFTNPDWINFAGLLISRGRLTRAERLLEESPLGAAEPYEYACLRANILAARQTGDDGGLRWLTALNSMFEFDGIEPIDILAGTGARIDRISCPPRSHTDDGPLVSVLMTNYCVGEAIRSAVASVLNQTWRNLELIVVDDCSPDDEFRRLRELEALDPRVRVLRTGSNSGTYTARNLALAHAQGEFVTCHDSDDWSHPRKIELQVSDLLRSDTIGNLSRLARTTEDLWFERFSATGMYVYPNTSSLMFRREPVVSRLGAWDPVRTGADTELYKRIELVFGAKLSVLPGAPLSFARTRAAALTSGTLGMGWSSPARRYYRAAWAQWHRALKEGASDPMLAADGQRTFPAPDSNLPSPAGAPAATCDVVIVADMRCKLLAGSIASELGALARAGMDIAVCHVPALRRNTAGRELLDPAIQATLNSGIARRIELDTELACKLVLVRDPTALQFSEGLESGIRPERVVIASDLPPFTHGSSSQSYTITMVDSAASRLFRRSAIWATANLQTRARLGGVLPTGTLAASPWHPPMLEHPASERRTGSDGTSRVIGFCLPNDKTPWKRWALLDRRLFPRNSPRVRVQVMGGRAPVDSDGFGWHILQHGEQGEAEFFAAIDFLPYFPQAGEDEGISDQLATALASGCIVLAPPRFAPLLGDGAVYADIDSVKSLVDSYSGDQSLMQAQSRRARLFAQEHLTPTAYARRIKQLLPLVPAT